MTGKVNFQRRHRRMNMPMAVFVFIMKVSIVSAETRLSLGSKCYLIGEDQVTWWEAHSRCADVGAELLQVESDLEHMFITDAINTTDGQYWVDARWDYTNISRAVVRWSGGSEVSAHLWISYEPNLTGDCVRYYSSTETSGKKLGDNPCSENYSYICENSAEIPVEGRMKLYQGKTKLTLCPLSLEFPVRSSIACSKKCLGRPDCDGMAYNNNTCQLLSLDGIGRPCGIDIFSPINRIYRINRCYK